MLATSLVLQPRSDGFSRCVQFPLPCSLHIVILRARRGFPHYPSQKAGFRKRLMRLTDIISIDKIKIPLGAGTKQQAIEELVDLLVSTGDVSDKNSALGAVLEREKTRTTGIGNGLAIPHGKSTAVGKLVMAIGRPSQEIDFESVDEKPVRLIILLLSPMDMTGPHIQALARVSRLMSIDGVRRAIERAPGAQEILKAIQDAEQAEAGA
ncbi:MAG: PTS sugar transporter subunit IIA [Planctomycetes bacterium]|nr:PTS sugar transporter subunit IIA [Planctomycetota bacterium]